MRSDVCRSAVMLLAPVIGGVDPFVAGVRRK
jgi:hypothetical protein